MPNPVPLLRRSRAIAVALLLPAFVPGQEPSFAQAPAKPGVKPVESTTVYSEAMVRAMWIKTHPILIGGSSPFTVRVSQNRSGDAAVGLIEQVLGSAGDMWKSSAWIAAVAASNAANRLLTDHEFLLKVRGFIDGPSAGMLMATTMLALIRHDPIRPDVTITGTVNPDGTIGPVAGIAEKLEGARKAGIKELGYPMIDNGDDGRIFAELEQLGGTQGVKAVPIPDIYAAYEFLTGVTLGRPVALDPAEMNISPALDDKYRMATAALLDEAKNRVTASEARFASALAKMKRPDREEYTRGRGLTFLFLNESTAATESKSPMLAQNKAMMADASSRHSERYLQWQQADLNDDTKALNALFSEAFTSAEEKLDSLLALIQPTLNAPTLAGRIAGFHDRMQYWSVRAQLLAANSQREDIRKRQQAHAERAASAKSKAAKDASNLEAKKISEEIRDVVLHLSVLESRARAFSEFAGKCFDDDKQPAPDQTALNKRLVEAYGPAAAAGLAYFDSTVIGMRSQGSDEVAAARRAAIVHTDIAFNASSKAAEHSILRYENGEGTENTPEAVLDRLACGAYAYLGMAGLMNKHYNLAEDNESAASGSIEHKTTLTLRKGNTVLRMMESSRTRLLEEASLVKRQLKFIPDCIKMNFRLGETKRTEPGDTAKLDALTSYWRAHFLCKMAQMMARAK